ncbi:MAG: response regulator [Acidobacteria bacterium]|nr:response regulator [Acidobacteriota bacterium]
MGGRADPRFGAPPPEKAVTVLTVSDCERDLDCLSEIFRHSRWRMLSAGSCGEAFRVLQSHRIPVVVCEHSLPDGNWRSVLNRLAQSAEQPLLIVASRQADDRLWAEVLNLGGYDVLSKPFDRSEAVRVIAAAWLHWRQRRAAHAMRGEPAERVFRATA